MTTEALKIYKLIKDGVIKSNAMFWKNFNKDLVVNMDVDCQSIQEELNNKGLNAVCVFDDDFPKVTSNLRDSEKPFFFLYKGDIELLKDENNNVAVIGVLTPTEDIIKRENKLVFELIKENLVIVSGLARGCDTISHKTCIENNGKTIAVLPTSFEDVYPKENLPLIDKIVKGGGLVITEYVTKPKERFQQIKRFIERDRLQALFSKGVVLIASFTQGNGDSGSRHALEKAKKYKRKRFVMYNEKTDLESSIFELNRKEIEEGAEIITINKIKELGE